MSARTEWEAQCDYWDSVTENINREDTSAKIFWMNGYDWASKNDGLKELVELCDDTCLQLILTHRGNWKVKIASNPSHGLNDWIVSANDSLEIACAVALKELKKVFKKDSK